MSREYVLGTKGIIAVFIGFIAVASLGIMGISVVYTIGNDNFDEGFDQGFNDGYDEAIEDTTPESYPFNPTIDGIWDIEEGWQTNESYAWLFAEYLVVDPYHMTATNFFYIHIKGGMLYILIDLVSDITDEPMPLEANEPIPQASGEGDEFISVWIDGDNSKNYFDEEGWALCPQEDDAHDNFYYDIEDGFYDIAYIPSYVGYELYYTTLGENNVSLAYGFNSSVNSNLEHRIWEIEINISALGYFNSSAFNIGFIGYGTMRAFNFFGFWSAPSDLGSNHFYMADIDEYLYFRCREVDGTDLWSIPNENADPNEFLPL